MPTIAIDFGTSNSQIAYLDSMGRAVSLQVDGYTKIPTELYYREKQDEIFIGLSAKELYEQDKLLAEAAGGNVEQTKTLLSANRLTAFKKEFCSAEVSFDAPARTLRHRDGKPFTWGEVVTAFFRFFKKKAEEHHFLGETIESVRLTHPVHFPSCELYRRAAEAAGFTSVTMIPEPEAAYSGYMQGGKPLGDTILVFDMGGGTLDLAVLEKRGEKWLVERQPLRIDIAGLDIDIAILRKILPQIQESDTDLSRVGADYTLLDAVRENIKEKWSRTERDVSFSYFFSQQNKRFHCTVPHDTMLPLVGKMMQPAYDKMRTYLVELGCVPTDVLMVGGSCLMPEIQRGVQQCMGNKVRVFTPNLGDTIVAEGAMLCELHEEGHHSIEPFEAKKIYHGHIDDISDDFRVIVRIAEKTAICYELYHSSLTQQIEKSQIGSTFGSDKVIKEAILSTSGDWLILHKIGGDLCDGTVESASFHTYNIRSGRRGPGGVCDSNALSHGHAAFSPSNDAFIWTCSSALIVLYNKTIEDNHEAFSDNFYIFPEEEDRKIYRYNTDIIKKKKAFRREKAMLNILSFRVDELLESAICAPLINPNNNLGCSKILFSHNGEWLAATYNTLDKSGIVLFKKKEDSINFIHEPFYSYDIKSKKIEFSSNDEYLITESDGKLIFISLKHGKKCETWELPPCPCLARFNKYTASADNTYCFSYDDALFTCSPDMNYIAISGIQIPPSDFFASILILNKGTGQILATIPLASVPKFLRFSADGSMLATNEGIWDVSQLLA